MMRVFFLHSVEEEERSGGILDTFNFGRLGMVCEKYRKSRMIWRDFGLSSRRTGSPLTETRKIVQGPAEGIGAGLDANHWT